MSRVLPHKLEMTWFGVAWSAERATNMSQSNDSPAPCADKGGTWRSHHYAVRCSSFRSTRTEEKEPRKGDDWILDPPTGKRKKNSLVWKVMQQFAPPIEKYSVRCSVELSVFLDPRNKRMSEDD